MKAYIIIETKGKPNRSRTFNSISAANESARSHIRSGADLVGVYNVEGTHVRTWRPTGPGNRKPVSVTFNRINNRKAA
jgi:hypothetical protein